MQIARVTVFVLLNPERRVDDRLVAALLHSLQCGDTLIGGENKPVIVTRRDVDNFETIRGFRVVVSFTTPNWGFVSFTTRNRVSFATPNSVETRPRLLRPQNKQINASFAQIDDREKISGKIKYVADFQKIQQILEDGACQAQISSRTA